MPDNLATDVQKSHLQDRVIQLINDTSQINLTGAAVQSKRYLTGDNQFVYITYSHLESNEVPPIKIQLYKRVEGGVHEKIYRLFSDQRLTCEDNSMIFGQAPATESAAEAMMVTEGEAEELIAIIDCLNADNERIEWGSGPSGRGGGYTPTPTSLDDGAVT